MAAGVVRPEASADKSRRLQGLLHPANEGGQSITDAALSEHWELWVRVSRYFPVCSYSPPIEKTNSAQTASAVERHQAFQSPGR